MKDIEEEYPLLPPEADDLSRAVKKRGVSVLGGKDAPAYKDRLLRSAVYRDIYHEVKRQYGLIQENGREAGYKKLKRKYLKGALTTVANYELPVHFANQVDALNEIEWDADE